MKNTRKRSMKGGGCGCSSGSVLGFPQAGGQRRKRLLGDSSAMETPMINSVGMPGDMSSMDMTPQKFTSNKVDSSSRDSRGMISQVFGSSGTNVAQNVMRRESVSKRQDSSQMPQSNITGTLASIQQKLNSINAKLSMPKSQANSPGLFGGGQKGGFLGLFENNSTPQPPVQPMMPQNMQTSMPTNSMPTNSMPMNTSLSAQNVVKMPAVSATNTGSANERIRNLENRLAQMESKGGFSFFGGRRRPSTRKGNKKRRSYRR